MTKVDSILKYRDRIQLWSRLDLGFCLPEDFLLLRTLLTLLWTTFMVVLFSSTSMFRVGSLSLLQKIFPTQELNRGLLHCWWILYQLSHSGSLWFEGRVHTGSLAEVSKEEPEEPEVTIRKVLHGRNNPMSPASGHSGAHTSLSQRAPRTVWALGFESHTPFPTASS